MTALCVCGHDKSQHHSAGCLDNCKCMESCDQLCACERWRPAQADGPTVEKLTAALPSVFAAGERFAIECHAWAKFGEGPLPQKPTPAEMLQLALGTGSVDELNDMHRARALLREAARLSIDMLQRPTDSHTNREAAISALTAALDDTAS